MSDSENEFENEIIGAEKSKKKSKQTRTPAQLRGLEKARLARSVKASKKQDSMGSLTYLAGSAVIFAGGLGGYYYWKRQQSAVVSPTKSVVKPKATPVPVAPIIQNIITPLEELKEMVIKTVKETMKKETPTESPIVITPVVAEPEPEPVAEPEPVLDFQELQKRRWATGSVIA